MARSSFGKVCYTAMEGLLCSRAARKAPTCILILRTLWKSWSSMPQAAAEVRQRSLCLSAMFLSGGCVGIACC